MDEAKTEFLNGTVEDIKFRNEQNGYTVLEIGCDDELVTAVGTFSDISVGESVKLSGGRGYRGGNPALRLRRRRHPE